jgi:hypothetical protein
LRAVDGRSASGDGRLVSIGESSPDVTELTAPPPAGAYSESADPNRRAPMKTLIMLAAAAALAGCGVETASTAATVAAAKKEELRQGQQTMQQAQQRIDAAMQQTQQRAANADK